MSDIKSCTCKNCKRRYKSKHSTKPKRKKHYTKTHHKKSRGGRGGRGGCKEITDRDKCKADKDCKWILGKCRRTLESLTNKRLTQLTGKSMDQLKELSKASAKTQNNKAYAAADFLKKAFQK